MNNFRWGIIAPGNISKSFATALNGLESATCYAVASRSIERAEVFAAEYGFEKSYGDYQQLIDDPLVDVVCIAAPHNMHAEQANACLRARQGNSV